MTRNATPDPGAEEPAESPQATETSAPAATGEPPATRDEPGNSSFLMLFDS